MAMPSCAVAKSQNNFCDLLNTSGKCPYKLYEIFLRELIIEIYSLPAFTCNLIKIRCYEQLFDLFIVSLKHVENGDLYKLHLTILQQQIPFRALGNFDFVQFNSEDELKQ